MAAMRMYFIGVTTGQSAIHRIFPLWMRLAGCEGGQLHGIDLPVGAGAESYRSALRTVRDDPASMGALVTTHKVAIVEHGGDLIDDLDDDAKLLAEASCLVRRGGRLVGSAFDVPCSGEALRQIVPANDMQDREVVIFGAGGAGTALATWITRWHPGSRVTLTDRSPARLGLVGGARYVLAGDAFDNDAVLGGVGDRVLVVNATGLGKDLPGSPITATARFPEDAVAWELNYRGDLVFLDHARAGGARCVDGWDYFVRGWSGITSRVFGFELTPELFARFAEAAEPFRVRRG